MNIHVHFDMQKISTNAWLHLYLTNSPTPLSLSLTASWNYHAKFYRVNMICACLFSNGDESWRQEQVLWCFDQLDAVRRGYVSLSVVELPVYWIISLWSMLEQSFFIYILYDSGMLNIPIKCGVFKVLYYFQ